MTQFLKNYDTDHSIPGCSPGDPTQTVVYDVGLVMDNYP